jgi:hypothetical protein
VDQNLIFNDQNDQIRRIGIEYSIVRNHRNDWMGQVGIEYSIVRNHQIKGIRIEYLIVRMVVLGGLEYSIVGIIGLFGLN